MIVKRSIIFVLCAALLSVRIAPAARAYNPETTHAALTEEIVRFYNALHPSARVSDEEKEWIIEGSIAEDTAPRWINHFYDPVRRTGWTGMNMGIIPAALARLLAKIGVSSEMPHSAIDWAHSGVAQDAYRSFGGVHTWESGLASYAKGDRKQAYTTLGHILHLLEDVSVPDHARDDTHAYELAGATGDPGSPHEAYAARWTRATIAELDLAPSLAREGARPPALGSLDEYLRAMAAYTNEHFFSADTIGDPRYRAPRIVREDQQFAYGRDERGAEFPLASVELVKDGSGRAVKAYRLVNRAEYDAMFKEQFVRAARQAILNGAGVVARFFEEARAAGGSAAGLQAEKAAAPIISIAGFASQARTALQGAASLIQKKTTGLLATARETLRRIAGAGGGGEIVSLAPRASSSARAAPAPSAQKPSALPPTLPPPKPSSKTTQTSVPKPHAAPVSPAATPSSTPPSAPKAPPLALKVAPKPPAPAAPLSAPPTTSASPSVPLGGVTAAPAPAPSQVVASSSSETASSTSDGGAGTIVQATGTPRVVVSEVQVEGMDDAGDEFIELYNAGDGIADLTGWSLQYISGGSESLAQLKKKNIPDGAAIAPGGYYLIVRGLSSVGDDGYRGALSPDLAHRTIALSGASTGGTILIVRNAELIESPEDPDIVDRVGYGMVQEGLAEGAAPAPLPKKGARIERKALRADGACAPPEEIGEGAGNGCDTNNNGDDFLLRAAPGDANVSASGTAPEAETHATAPLALSATFVSSSMSVTLSWDAASSTRYALYDPDVSSDSPPIFETDTESAYSVPVDEIARTYRFSIRGESSSGTIAVAEASITIPSFVRSVRFSRDSDTHNYFADVSFDTAPFIPPRWSGFAGGPLWQGLVFYFDRVPPRENFVLTTSGGFTPPNPDGVAASFIFTFNPEFHSEIGGGLKQESTLVSAAAGHFTIPLALPEGAAPSGEDYLTVAYYDFSRVGGGTQDLSLVAIDNTKYSFAE